jgi:hypothetical protein
MADDVTNSNRTKASSAVEAATMNRSHRFATALCVAVIWMD